MSSNYGHTVLEMTSISRYYTSGARIIFDYRSLEAIEIQNFPLYSDHTSYSQNSKTISGEKNKFKKL